MHQFIGERLWPGCLRNRSRKYEARSLLAHPALSFTTLNLTFMSLARRLTLNRRHASNGIDCLTPVSESSSYFEERDLLYPSLL